VRDSKPLTLEANTRNPAAAEGGVAEERTGFRKRVVGLLSPNDAKRDGGSPANGLRPREPAVRLEHYLGKSKVSVLHHRRLSSNGLAISHLIVGPAGVTVVDSRRYGGRGVKLRDGAVRVGLRKRTDLIDRLVAQVDAIRELLSGTPYGDVPVEAALASRKVEGVPIVPNPTTRIIVCGTRRIAGEASRPGPLPQARVNALAAFLERELPAA
jgi:hypothetical protein